MTDYFLFVNPSFISGMARVLDFGGTLNEYNASPTPEEADTYALRSDWKAVGDDIRTAMSVVEKEMDQDGER